MNIVFLGFPGSGKSAQARFIADKLNMTLFSPGDIFWGELAKKDPLGLEVHDYLSAGKLVPDWLVLRMLKDRLATETRGILFDGFPRTMEQAEGLDAWLASRSGELDGVIYFNLPEAAAAARLADRVVCAGCGKPYPPLPPGQAASCGLCGGKLLRREDDVPEVIKKRMMAYRDQTEQLLTYYRSNGILKEIKADQAQQAVSAQIALALKSLV